MWNSGAALLLGESGDFRHPEEGHHLEFRSERVVQAEERWGPIQSYSFKNGFLPARFLPVQGGLMTG